MTTKRFVETVSTGIVTDNVTGKEYRCEMRIDEDLLELLNEQHEKIEELKFENKELIELIRYCYENWSEEKKKMVGEISNGLLGE